MKTLALLLLVACSPAWKDGPHDRLFQVEPVVKLAPAPPRRDPSDMWNKVELTFVRPLGQLISPGTYIEWAADSPRADDINRFGEVPDSLWFENRAGKRPITDDEAGKGAATDTGMAPGPLSVISGKIDGVSPGFVVRDTAGIVWYIKFDHPAFPEVSTSAEVISSRLLWMCGYNVPSMQVGDIELPRFVLDPKATTHNRLHETIPLTHRAFTQLLANTNPNLKQQIRVLYSRQIPGKLLGPFDYRGKDGDDPNDTISHEHRRSLRALWLFSAWVNNTDTREWNTMDSFREVTPDHRGVVEHYLIDFGDSFGATGLGEKAAIEGWEYLVDWTAIIKNLSSFGVRYPPYLHVERSAFRSVGLFESKEFQPKHWRPAVPNPAFDQRTKDDLFWAASIVAAIQPSQIRAAVESGQYSEEGAANYVAATLIERRRKLLEYAFRGYLELARPRIDGSTLVLDDLRAMGQLTAFGPIEYDVAWDGPGTVLARGLATPSPDDMTMRIPLATIARPSLASDPFVTVTLRAASGDLQIHLRVHGNRLIPIGSDR
ncbi:MAG: hypothetical protein QM831_16290 [Kofleriaceae bacterium]